MGVLDVLREEEDRLALLRNMFERSGAGMRPPLSMAGPSRAGESISPTGLQQHEADLAQQAREAAAVRLARGYRGTSRAGLPPPDIADIMKSAGIGIANGLISTAGAIPDGSAALHENLDPLIDGALRRIVGLPIQSGPTMPPDLNKMFGSENLKKGIERLAGEFYEPATPIGRTAETVGELSVPNLLGGVLRRGGGVLRAARNAGKLRNIGKKSVD